IRICRTTILACSPRDVPLEFGTSAASADAKGTYSKTATTRERLLHFLKLRFIHSCDESNASGDNCALHQCGDSTVGSENLSASGDELSTCAASLYLELPSVNRLKERDVEPRSWF